jgi:tetratricopeptide (TPR) repeat protein
LTLYAGWASRFGEAERGAEMVERAIRLDPNFQMWATGIFAYAYFMAGQYENALGMLERTTTETYTSKKWIMRAGSLAALERTQEAKNWVAKALQVHPELNVEMIANDPAYSSAEQQRFAKTMRLAGYPLCSTLENLTKLRENPTRLPECETSEASGG